MVRHRNPIRSVMDIEHHVITGRDQLGRVQRPVVGGDISRKVAVLRCAAGASALVENSGRIGILIEAALPAPDEGRPLLRDRRALFVARQSSPDSVSVLYVGSMWRVTDAD